MQRSHLKDEAGFGGSASEIALNIAQHFRFAQMPESLRREVLRELVEQQWGELPVFSTLKRPEISVLAKATVGAGVVPIFMHPSKQTWHALVLRPGTHYKGERYPAIADDVFFMLAGGFINLSETISLADIILPNPNRAEHPFEGAVRELTEEVVDDTGKPILTPAINRLFPMDALTLSFPSGERRLVIGYVLSLTDAEISKVVAHVDRVKSDDLYRRRCRMHTVNSASGHPEVCQADIVPLSELITKECRLLYADQRGLFKTISRFLTSSNIDFLNANN